MTYKELRNLVNELKFETEALQSKLKDVTNEMEVSQAMCSYIATGYATFVIATEEKNAIGIEDVMVLRDNIIHEAREVMDK
jgi:uridine kinase